MNNFIKKQVLKTPYIFHAPINYVLGKQVGEFFKFDKQSCSN